MQIFLSFGGKTWRSVGLLAALLVGLGWMRPQAAQASHIRAGDIQAKVDTIDGNPNRIFFKLTLYRDTKGVDQPEVTIYFGDGTRQDAIPKAKTVSYPEVETDVFTYTFEHTFPGAGVYPVSFVGENRNANVLNMASSAAQTFYVSTTITINPAYGRNHSPVLRAPALDRAAVGQVFLHNPAGFDADGDSLAYHLRTCQQVDGGTNTADTNNKPVPATCTNYVYPDDPTITPGLTPKQVPYSGVPAGDPTQKAFIKQDPYTGQITWNAPARAGIYNIAFVVEEWRRTSNGKRQIGTVIRDMQIIVTATNNLPPVITVPADVCVIANETVTLNVSATDGSSPSVPATNVQLSAYSGTIPPATFVQNTFGTTATGTYTWTPDCSKVSNQPYLVVFKAQDTQPNLATPVLIDEKPVRITVVGPPPKNLRAVPTNGAKGLVSLLSWDSYTCQNASQLLIFRRENSYPFTPGPCETGLPASAGYTQVGAVSASTTSFADDNGGSGLSRGKTYCYRIYATFPLPSGGNSIASNETCVTFNGRSAMLTNVDVTKTDATTGQILVKWTQPRADNNGTFGAPAGYRLSRSIGTGPATLVATITNLADTTYVDQNLNTVANQYTYTLVFFNTDRSGATPIEKTEASPTATSVRTSLVPDGLTKSITVNWTYQVPWDNSKQPSRIYRKDPGSTTFNQIATVTPGATSGTYVDKDPTLQSDQTYCYYVQTTGQYPQYSFLNNLLNNSQQVCTPLVAVPCTPILSLQVTNCDSLLNKTLGGSTAYPEPNQTYQNVLHWTVGNAPTGCSTAAVRYRIFRSDTEGGTYVLIDSTAQLSYVDRNQPKPLYCYKVQAVAANGQRSALSNSACQSDCVFFVLPNIFTPNGDGINDVFRPKTTSPLLRTHIQIFNRWGRKVYESDKYPTIEWTGGGTAGESATSGLVSNGIYYYLAEVEFADAAHTKRTYKGWVEVAR